MRKTSAIAFFALALAACSSSSSSPDGGAPANHLLEDNVGGMDPRCPGSFEFSECGQSCPSGLGCLYTEDGVNVAFTLSCNGDAGQTSKWVCGT